MVRFVDSKTSIAAIAQQSTNSSGSMIVVYTKSTIMRLRILAHSTPTILLSDQAIILGKADAVPRC